MSLEARSAEPARQDAGFGLGRDYRLAFGRVIDGELIRRVEDVVGQKVVGYHSEVLLTPTGSSRSS